jgi:hypothetical protein
MRIVTIEGIAVKNIKNVRAIVYPDSNEDKEAVVIYNRKKLEKIKYIEDMIEEIFRIEPNMISFTWQPTIFSILIDRTAKLEILLHKLNKIVTFLYVLLDDKVTYTIDDFNLDDDFKYCVMKFLNDSVDKIKNYPTIKNHDILLILMALVEKVKSFHAGMMY